MDAYISNSDIEIIQKYENSKNNSSMQIINNIYKPYKDYRFNVKLYNSKNNYIILNKIKDLLEQGQKILISVQSK